MRHLYRNTASGAEAAGCAHGAHGAQTPGSTPLKSLVSRFRVLLKRYTYHENQYRNIVVSVSRVFFGIPENAQKRPKQGEFHGIL
jgi:hypothetical protein